MVRTEPKIAITQTYPSFTRRGFLAAGAVGGAMLLTGARVQKATRLQANTLLYANSTLVTGGLR